MSWWNDLSTHRNALTRDIEGAYQHATSPEHLGYPAHPIAGNYHFSNGVAPDDALWGTAVAHGDIMSSWQTPNGPGNAGQRGVSENSALWGPQPPHPSVSPPPRGVGALIAAPALSGEGMLGEMVRPLAEGNSRSSFNASGAVVSTAVNDIAIANTNTTAHQGANAEEGDRDGGNMAEDPLDGAAAAAGAGTKSVADDGVLLYDDVDLDTISSLIASLQGNGAQVDLQEDTVDTLGPLQGELSHHKTPTATQALPPTAHSLTIDSTSVATGAQPGALRMLPQLPHPRSTFADPVVNTRERELDHNCSGNTPSSSFMPTAEGSGSGNDRSSASCVSPFGSVATKSTSDMANIAPLHLTPSILEGLLANFQSALKGCSEETSVTSPTQQVTDAEHLHSDRYGSPDVQDELGGMSSAAESGKPATEGTLLASHGSPLMRSYVSSIVAHKLNIDGNLRGSQIQDARSGVTAAANMSGSCSSPSTPIRERGTSISGRRVPSHHLRNSSLYLQERGASPDSSTDRFFSQTTPPTTKFTSVKHFASSSTTEDNAASHRYLFTESEISLPVAASTYSGSDALHQHADERGCITVVDPQRRKLHVPLSAIQTTKALNGRLKTPSLCLLFQSGRCRQGENCYQVHIDPATVDRLRADVESMPCCCLLHGDCNGHLADPAAYEGRTLCIAGHYSVPLSRVAYTAGLQRVLQDEASSVLVNPSVLCRLHGQPGGCRFGADCKFIHVCGTILNNELAQVMSSATTVATAPTGVPSKQTQQQQPPQHPLPRQHPLPPQRLGSSAPGSPSTFMHSRKPTNVMNLTFLNSSLPPATVVPLQMVVMPSGSSVSATGEVPLPIQSARPLTSTGSPMLQDVRRSNSSQLMGSPGAGVTAGGAALYNRNFVSTPRSNGGGGDNNNHRSSGNDNNANKNSGSLVSSANFSVQLSNVTTSSLSATYSNASGSANTAAPPPGQFFKTTPVQQQQQPTVAMPGSPISGYHLCTLGTQSASSPHQLYLNSAMGQTPNHSGAGSPVNLGLPSTRSMLNTCGVTRSFAPPAGPSNGLSSLMQHHMLQQQSTSPQLQPQQPQPQPQHSAPKQFYVQQINQDGTVSFVPVNMVQNLGD